MNPNSKPSRSLDTETLVASVDEIEVVEDTESDLSTASSVDAAGEERRILANAEMEERIFDLRQDRNERKTYASRFLWLVVAWVSAMTIMLFVEQYCGNPGEACLSDSVLMTALATTTATIVSILAFVGRYLFK